MYDDYNNSNALDLRGYVSGYGYRIDIYSECSDAVHAADIIREHRGRYLRE